MSEETRKLEELDDPVPLVHSNCNGPSARALTTFLTKKGEMSGGDSACYYWGYVLLEKLRIYNGEKKSRSRLEAEEDLPNSHAHDDPGHRYFICVKGHEPSYSDLANRGRL